MMRPRHLTVAVVIVAGLALLTAACSNTSSGSATANGSTTVDVEMVDIAFKPATLTVAKGEKVRLRFTNHGAIAHDAFIGDPAAQGDHEMEMRSPSTAMHHGGDEPAVTVAAGKSATLTHTFDRAGTTEIGCHQPGHYAAGMKITVTVT